jgi:hypothetical protein
MSPLIGARSRTGKKTIDSNRMRAGSLGHLVFLRRLARKLLIFGIWAESFGFLAISTPTSFEENQIMDHSPARNGPGEWFAAIGPSLGDQG